MTKTTLKLLAGASGLAYAALGTTGAWAAGTVSGSTITNTATVNYSVGGVAQTAVQGSNSFTVDRKVSMTVAEVGTTTTSVVPGQTAAVTTFSVVNTSNAPLDLGLSVTQAAGGTAIHGGTDTFDVTAPLFYNDTNGNGVYDAGTDLAVTFLDELAADATRTIFVVANIPNTEVNGAVAGVTLVAQAREPGTAGTQGVVIAATAGANTAGVDTVLADGAGFGDAAFDGLFGGRDDYTVASATLTITKTSKVISDPVNGTTNPKNIPGATIEYCVQVANTGGASATSVSVGDPLPTTVLYTTGTTFLNATVTGGVCNADGTLGGTYAAGPPEVVSGNLGTVAAGATTALRFRATIK